MSLILVSSIAAAHRHELLTACVFLLQAERLLRSRETTRSVRSSQVAPQSHVGSQLLAVQSATILWSRR